MAVSNLYAKKPEITSPGIRKEVCRKTAANGPKKPIVKIIWLALLDLTVFIVAHNAEYPLSLTPLISESGFG